MFVIEDCSGFTYCIVTISFLGPFVHVFVFVCTGIVIIICFICVFFFSSFCLYLDHLNVVPSPCVVEKLA